MSTYVKKKIIFNRYYYDIIITIIIANKKLQLKLTCLKMCLNNFEMYPKTFQLPILFRYTEF